jgi:hypothetical protein
MTGRNAVRVATLTADGIEHPLNVSLVMREGKARQISGRLVGVAREEILGLGPVLALIVPGLLERPVRCVVHLDGSFESL